MTVAAVLLLVGAALALLTVRTPAREAVAEAEEHHFHHCAVGGPAMEECPHHGPLETAGESRA